MTELAPIALFVFRRLDHTRRSIEALKENPLAAKSDLFVFCDGPRDESERDAVESVRAYVRNIKGFQSLAVVERAKNLGLSKSIITGVSSVLEDRETVIVIEDDILTSPNFLKFINEGLARYADDQRVASIHGYVFPVKQRLPETFFLRGADCWGWGTWRRSWELFNPNGLDLLKGIEQLGLTHEFDFGGAFPYTQMLRDQIEGRNDSWAIRWYASAFLANKLTLYAGESLVQNIGVDGSGTHGGASSAYQGNVWGRPIELKTIAVEDSAIARKAFAEFAKHLAQPHAKRSRLARIWERLGWR